jgi:hypothetical protein
MRPVINTIESADAATLERIGRWLIVLGILVWGVWLVVKIAGGGPQLEYFLPIHLAGVVPGSVLSRWSTLNRWRQQNR